MVRWATTLALSLVSASALAGSFFQPAPVKVAIPLHDAWCLDPGATPTAWSYGTLPTLVVGGQRVGTVQPGTCAWVGGYVRQGIRVQLACPDHAGGWLLSPAAKWATTPGGSCAVPADQDFR
jgi:hypothetical protein